MVSSIQTFGSFANFQPHIHALVTDGVMTRQGEFLPLPRWTLKVVEEVFRRLVLARLVQKARPRPVRGARASPPGHAQAVETIH